jgi:hypothetical protein
VWRRSLLDVPLCLLIGAVLSLGVAWYARVRKERRAESRTSIIPLKKWLEPVPVSWPPPRGTMETTAWAMREVRTEFDYTSIRHIGPDTGLLWRFEAGWPALALGGTLTRGTDINGVRLSGLWEASPGRRSIWLPLYPLWPGFALNTIFYSGLAWGLWQVPLAIRRRRRRRLNRCVKCGYDRAGLAADAHCPECGTIRATTSARRTQ